MSPQELRTVLVLASIFALRMLGLCMLLPVFAVAAYSYEGATAKAIGMAVGVYGLLQALLQVPFGVLSDKFGRKPLIFTGLLFILLGSMICAVATNIYLLILGRALQGCGAIGSVVIATLIDRTSECIRGRAMAVLGASIGLAFVLALILGPWLNQHFGMSSIFVVTGGMALACIGLLVLLPAHASNYTVSKPKLPDSRQLFSYNLGAFVLHASLAGLFLVIPVMLQQRGVADQQTWKLYCAVLTVAMLICWQIIKFTERAGDLAPVLRAAIVGLVISPIMLLLFSSVQASCMSLLIYFTAFCVLEASLPTLVGKHVLEHKRGSAMGMYATLQFMGVFFGGMIGGWLHGEFGVLAVVGFSVGLALIWLLYSSPLAFKQALSS